jgi:ABC-2 type transport system ATP-binding protein
MNEQPAVVCRNVSYRFRRNLALNHLSLNIGGGVCGVLGPNGAGKTTLIRLLTTIYDLQEGEISILGTDLGTEAGRKRARRDVGYLPQSFGFYPSFSVRQFVEYFALLQGVPTADLRLAVDESLDAVDMLARASNKMRSLSGGMVRRVGIAQAIVHRPRLLILDEPTVGLDPDQRYQLRVTLDALSARSTILISTHQAEDIHALGGQVLVMNEGSVRFSGRTEELSKLGGQIPATDSRDLRSPIERGYSVAQTLPPVA